MVGALVLSETPAAAFQWCVGRVCREGGAAEAKSVEATPSVELHCRSSSVLPSLSLASTAAPALMSRRALLLFVSLYIAK